MYIFNLNLVVTDNSSTANGQFNETTDPQSNRTGIIQVMPIHEIEENSLQSNQSNSENTIDCLKDLSNENNLENDVISVGVETTTLYCSPYKVYENLINSIGLVLLFCIIVLLLPMITLFFHNGNGVKYFTDLFYVVYCCFPVGLPTLYFSLKPNSLSIAMKNVPF